MTSELGTMKSVLSSHTAVLLSSLCLLLPLFLQSFTLVPLSSTCLVCFSSPLLVPLSSFPSVLYPCPPFLHCGSRLSVWLPLLNMAGFVISSPPCLIAFELITPQSVNNVVRVVLSKAILSQTLPTRQMKAFKKNCNCYILPPFSPQFCGIQSNE